jgi:trehalose-phosphatase
MVPLRGLKIFGSHGLEGSWSGRSGGALSSGLRRRLARLAEGAETLAAGVPGVLVERKPAGVAIHDRRVPANLRAGWTARLRRWLAEQDLRGLELLDGRRVVELRPVGVHKGRVAASLPEAAAAPATDHSVVAMGDDRTDEDLFRAIRGRGLSVRVGRPGKRSVARARLASPTAVCRFLRQLAGAGSTRSSTAS